MHTTFIQYLIICPLVFLGGLVDAIAGGGGLISLPAYLIAGVPAHTAVGTNKVSSFMGTTLTTVSFWRRGYIKPKLSLMCVVCALAGSYGGASLNLLIDEKIFNILMLFIIPVVAFFVFRKKNLDAHPEPFDFGKTAVISCAVALIIGAYDGFYGPGTGTFLILLLTGAARLDLNSAAGTTKAINLASNVAAMVTYLVHGEVILLTGVIAGVFGIAGNWLGSRFFSEKGAKIVKPVIFVVLGVFFVRVIWQLVTGT